MAYVFNIFTGNFDVVNSQLFGSATLVAGTVVVPCTAVTANSDIFLTGQGTGGTLGELTISARTPGVSFTITSSSATDTRLVAWLLYEPATAGSSATGSPYGLLLALTQP